MLTRHSFQTGRSHILLVTDSPGRDEAALGVVTLEDVVEVSRATVSGAAAADLCLQELIGKEIIVSVHKERWTD